MERGNSSEETEEETGEGVGLEPADGGSVEGEAGVSGGAEASAGAKGEDGPSASAAPGSDELISDETIVDVTKAVMGAVGGPAGIAIGEAAEWLGEQTQGSDDD